MPRSHSRRKATPARSAAHGWWAVFLVSLGAFVVVTSEFLPIGLLTHIAGGLHVSDGTAGLMVTIPGLIAAVAAPLMTIVTARLDRRVVVLGLIALLVVSNLIAAVAPNFAVMLLGRVLFGVSLGGFWTIAVTLGGRLVSAASLARATSVILAGISFATVIGVPAGTFIANLVGWRMAFATIGVVALLVGIAKFFVLPSLPPPPAPGVRQLTQLLRHSDARLGLLTVALVIAGHFAAYTYVTPFLKENPAITPNFLGTLLLAYGVAGIVGNFAGGVLAARHLRATLGGVVSALAGAILLLPFARENPAAITTLLIVWGLAFGALPIALQLWVFKAAPEAMEGGAALLVSTFQIFIALGSVLGGRLVDAQGTSAVMWTGGTVALSALSIVALSRHTRKPALATSQAQPQPHLA